MWSGDIASSWSTFIDQLAAGLNMGMAGIPWWTTDIGGLHGGNLDDQEFRELFTRWFQWGCFCPVMRFHGDREPKPAGQPTASGAANEIWIHGDEVYQICKKYIGIREQLRGHTRGLMEEAHEKGSPVIRPMFYKSPKQCAAWEAEQQYMYGDKYLSAPVLYAGKRTIRVWEPEGAIWKSWETEQSWMGAKTIEVPCPIEWTPVFIRNDSPSP